MVILHHRTGGFLRPYNFSFHAADLADLETAPAPQEELLQNFFGT